LSADQIIPGSWVERCQNALDRLAMCSNTDDVIEAFGSARTLTEEVLGFPLSGGAATRRAIRLVGVLVSHRLGPALAAEALSWAACTSKLLDPSTTERFLEDVAHAGSTYRPLEIADRLAICDQLTGRPPAKRLATLLEMWWKPENGDRRWDLRNTDPWHVNAYQNPSEFSGESHRWAQQAGTDFYRLFDGDDTWWWLSDPIEATVYAAPATVATRSGERQMAWFEGLPAQAKIDMASDPIVFDLDDRVVAAWLQEQPRQVLANSACPPGLLSRVKHPYDLATLELALASGRWKSAGRVARLLQALDHDVFADLFGRYRYAIVEVLRKAGALRSALDRSRGDTAAAIIAELPADQLTASDIPLVLESEDGRLLITCPGIPAVIRPPQGHPLVTGDFIRWMWEAGPQGGGVIWYRADILELDGQPLPFAEAWTVSLPFSLEDLKYNAGLMRNCTADYFGQLAGGKYLLLILERGDIRVNVGLAHDCSRWEVDELQARPRKSIIGDQALHRAIRILASTLSEHVGNATAPQSQRRTPVAKRRSRSS
jgi:hypothetical protein